MEHMAKVMERAARDTHADFILKMDRKQMSKQAKLCPINPEHGPMGVHADGTALICTFITKRDSGNTNIRMCNGHTSISRGDEVMEPEPTADHLNNPDLLN